MNDSQQYRVVGGVVSDPAKPSTAEGQPQIPEPAIRIGQQPVRVRMDEDGTAHIESVQPRGYQTMQSESVDVLDSAVSASGAPQPRAALTPDSVIDHPSIGGSMRLREAINLGWAVKTAEGYAWIGVDGPAPAADATTKDGEKVEEKAQQKTVEGDLTDADLTGLSIPPTTPESDKFVADVESATSPAFIDAALAALSKGEKMIDSYVEDAAQRSGLEVAQVRAGLDQRVEAGIKAAQTAAAHVGVPAETWDAFVGDMWARDADAAQDVVRGMAKNDVGPLLRAAKSFVQRGGVALSYSDADVLHPETQFGNGITARRASDGKVVLSIPGHEDMTYQQAVKMGVIKVERKS